MANFSLASSLQSIERLFSAPRKKFDTPTDAELLSFFTPFDEAIAEIERRRQDSSLKAAVEAYLGHDIPEIFNGPEPIFYLSRHVATPNYETLRFIELTKDHKFPTVIGQDPKDKFVSNNCMKRALGKMHVTKGTARNGDEITENFTVVNFTTEQGKQLHTVATIHGDDLINFHNRLLREIYPKDVIISDESSWIDRQGRGRLLEHYVQYLTLMLAHGITMEDFVEEDHHFITAVLQPAIAIVQKRFGLAPLICRLIPEDMAIDKDWVGYPSIVYPFVKQQFDEPRKAV